MLRIVLLARKSSLAKDAFFYTASNAIPALMGLALIPVLTRVLSPTEYGLVSLFQIILALLSACVGGGVDAAVQAHAMKRGSHADRYLCSGMLLIVVYCLGMSFASVTPIPAYVLNSVSFPEKYYVFLVVAAGCQALLGTLSAYWQITCTRRAYFTQLLINALVAFCVSIFLVWGLSVGWTGRMYGIVAGLVVSLLYALAILAKSRLAAPSVRDMKSAAFVGLPMIAHTLSGMALASTDRLVLTVTTSLHDVGLYAVALQLAGIIGFLQDGLGKAWLPWVTRHIHAGDSAKPHIVRAAYRYIALLVALSLFASLFLGLLLPYLTAPEYVEARPLIAVLCAAYAFNGMYKIVVPFALFREKTRQIALTTTLAAGLNAGLAILLSIVCGAIGVALAYVLAMAFLFLVTFLVAYRSYPMPWFVRQGSVLR